jgi:2-succinyl-5-enolpyruvyl-6-hydroxy-3-cyclohexene-1-carboxylate synthase
MQRAPNRNLLWASVFVDELARSGLTAVCIAPGSRSTPLAVAFAEHPGITVYSHIDERSAAFFALGHALATDKPVALLCSSGTAGANFYPAIIEAHYSNVPLIVLTADRQHELRESGANQTIDQIKLYGDHVLWFYDVALPEADPPAVAVRNLRTLACRAYAKANGMVRGAVHINFPFRKPLEPIVVESDVTDRPEYAGRADGAPFTRFERGVATATEAQLSALRAIVEGAQRGLLVCGPRCPRGAFAGAVEALSQRTGYVLLADPLSGVRYSSHLCNAIGGYDTFLRVMPPAEKPEVILFFGAMPTSQTLDDYLNSCTGAYRVMISENDIWKDQNHRLDMFIHAEPALLCQELVQRITSNRGLESWYMQFVSADNATTNAISTADALFDGKAVGDLTSVLPTGSSLFVASSLAVRHLDQFGLPIDRDISVYANRGASGIDGTISSAFGVAAANPHLPTVLITGDLAFYHDMNGLLALKRCGIKNLTIVLINNDGGGIFQRLPIAGFDPPFTDLFLTPHGLDFEPAVRMYGFDYVRAETLEGLRGAVTAAVGGTTPTIIEVRTDSRRDLERRNEITQRVLQTLQQRTTSS